MKENLAEGNHRVELGGGSHWIQPIISLQCPFTSLLIYGIIIIVNIYIAIPTLSLSSLQHQRKINPYYYLSQKLWQNDLIKEPATQFKADVRFGSHSALFASQPRY